MSRNSVIVFVSNSAMFTLCRAKQILGKGCAHSPFSDEPSAYIALSLKMGGKGRGPWPGNGNVPGIPLPFCTKAYGGISYSLYLIGSFLENTLKRLVVTTM